MDERRMWEWLRRAKLEARDVSGSDLASQPETRDVSHSDLASPPEPGTEADPWQHGPPPHPEDPQKAETLRRALRAALDSLSQAPVEEPRKASGSPQQQPSHKPRPGDTDALFDEKPGPSGRDIHETLDYLEEVLADYERFVRNVGGNGINAPMLLYYRDQVQDVLDDLTVTGGPDVAEYWRRTVELDGILRAHSQEFVDEVGWGNFKQYQIINDPPPQNWWWYLNRETRGPSPPQPFWKIWRTSG